MLKCLMQTDFESCGLLILIGCWYCHWKCINMIENVAIISGWHLLCAFLLRKQSKAQLFLKESSFIFVLADRAQREEPPLKVNKKLSGLLKIAEGNMGEWMETFLCVVKLDDFVCSDLLLTVIAFVGADEFLLMDFFYYYFQQKEGLQLLWNVTFFLSPYQQEPICFLGFFVNSSSDAWFKTLESKPSTCCQSPEL